MIGSTVLDARTGETGRVAYAKGHLHGAIHADLDRDLAAPPTHPEHGGRHSLPSLATWAATLGRWGISRETHVLVYDDQGGANAAARAWWMLRAVGHTRVSVLSGGWQAALSLGLPVDDNVPAATDIGPYPISRWELPIATLEDVKTRLADRSWGLIDVRSRARYRGESEPIDPVAGHIPGAINMPFGETLDAHGHFKSASELRALYEPRLHEGQSAATMVHCGSGVTACHTLLALEHVGLHGASLYVGSWSEWCRQADAVIAKE